MATIDLNRIATFVRVVETGSFTAAARTLGLPVSSVSRAVSQLENELGARLLHRTTRKLSMTDSGQHFFARMHAVIGEAEEAAQAVAGFTSDPRGVVRITAPAGDGELMPRVFASVLRRLPGVVLELRFTNQALDLAAEGIDLAIRGGVLEDSSLVARKLAGSELQLFASPAYLARRGGVRTPADLARHDCLGFVGREGKRPWRLRGPRGETTVNVSGPLVCDDMIFLRGAVRAGLGLALLPQQIATADLAAGTLVRVLPRHSFPGGAMYLLWPSRKLVPARVVAVREALIEELTKAYGA